MTKAKPAPADRPMPAAGGTSKRQAKPGEFQTNPAASSDANLDEEK